MRIRFLLANIFIFLFIVYLFHHTLTGNRSIFALMELNRKTQEKQTDLENLRATRLNLEHKVTLLKNESLDLDLLDEQARKILGYSNNKETILFIEKDENKTGQNQ